MEGIIRLEVKDPYTCEVKGFGEIFEIKSVERIRKRLKRKYSEGMLFLSSNKAHSGRGFTRDELERTIREQGMEVAESGYADAPPWRSDPMQEGEMSSKMSIPVLPVLIPLLFTLWIPLFEGFYRKPKKAHVAWAFGVKDEA